MALTKVDAQLVGGAITADSAGNVGIGVTPSAWGGGFKVTQVSNSALWSNTSSLMHLTGNAYYDGANYKYISTDNAQDYYQFQGTHVWRYAPSGTAGANVTFTEAMRIDSSGNLLVGTTSPAGFEKLNVTSTLGAFTQRIYNTNASAPLGLAILYTGASPNSTASDYIYCQDSTLRFSVRSNGGIVNYSANNANLSDERTKKDIVNAGKYLDKICAIPVRTFKYKDQTDDQLNLGVIAQEVEIVAPELVDVSGFGDTPEDGIPLKAIYQTDLQYALMKAIQELKAELDATKAEVAALKAGA